MSGKLFLIPSLLSPEDASAQLPAAVIKIIEKMDFFLVENEKSARHFLKAIGVTKPIRDFCFYRLDEHSKPEEFRPLLKKCAEGKNIGIISEAGCPGVADPGAEMARMAHEMGIEVRPLVGPSSILLALMASGLNGQCFAFAGYLPIPAPERQRKIRELERKAHIENQTQIFIETPYRNNALLNDILQTCAPKTRLCIAVEITSKNEWIKTLSVAQWPKAVPDLHKKPAVFLIGRG